MIYCIGTDSGLLTGVGSRLQDSLADESTQNVLIKTEAAIETEFADNATFLLLVSKEEQQAVFSEPERARAFSEVIDRVSKHSPDRVFVVLCNCDETCDGQSYFHPGVEQLWQAAENSLSAKMADISQNGFLFTVKGVEFNSAQWRRLEEVSSVQIAEGQVAVAVGNSSDHDADADDDSSVPDLILVEERDHPEDFEPSKENSFCSRQTMERRTKKWASCLSGCFLAPGNQQERDCLTNGEKLQSRSHHNGKRRLHFGLTSFFLSPSQLDERSNRSFQGSSGSSPGINAKFSFRSLRQSSRWFVSPDLLDCNCTLSIQHDDCVEQCCLVGGQSRVHPLSYSDSNDDSDHNVSDGNWIELPTLTATHL
eukprot:m.34956 g.34956  ORF g.34956 m.34956 type:complete len:367 (+) comp32038_c0_seq2:227-1327(+)